ncbi:MAG TPA: hypothetical protein VF188_03155 [Longimicrobiales bacterium]
MTKFRLLMLMLVVVAAACSSPTEPRVPTPDEQPKDPPPDQQGFAPMIHHDAGSWAGPFVLV